MERDKKDYIIIALLIGLIASTVGNWYISSQFHKGNGPPIPNIFVVGTLWGPSELDPVYKMDYALEDVINQVCEGLFTHNLSDPNLGIIPLLAEDYWTWDSSGTRFTVSLRQNVSFHDGTTFNAEAVKWNFERINWFLNGTGTLNTTLSQHHYLWEFGNGTVILDPYNPITINSDYNVTINLRNPNTIIESLLCHTSAVMLSPESTPKNEYIPSGYGRIVGTGPFVYDYYLINKEITLHRWDNYWRTPAFFEKVIFTVINDAYTRNNAMLDHSIDYLIGSLRSLFPTFDADATIAHWTGQSLLSYYYLGMGNKRINRTWRQAISWAINYTYIIEELQDGTVFRSNGPLAPNFPMYDPTIQAPTYNLTKAREIVVSMGFGDMGWSDAQWQSVSLKSFNYTYKIGHEFQECLLLFLRDNLALIGIEVIDQGMDWADFYYIPYGLRRTYYIDSLELFWAGWGPMYLSPYSMITTLFSNKSNIDFYGHFFMNLASYYNHSIEMWLDEVLRETNPTRRAELYSKILHQIVKVDMPHAFGYHPYCHSIHLAYIKGVPYNSMGKLYIYPMYQG